MIRGRSRNAQNADDFFPRDQSPPGVSLPKGGLRPSLSDSGVRQRAAAAQRLQPERFDWNLQLGRSGGKGPPLRSTSLPHRRPSAAEYCAFL
jgi:hypothetical protein